MLRLSTALALLVPLAGAASAATGNVLFNGNVAPTCTLTVNSNGTMTVATSLQSLSSQNAGGSPGSVTLTTTGGVSVGVDPVTTVDAPAEDTTATAWTPTFSSAGAHAISQTGTTTALTVPGSSTLTVHLAGAKTGADRFANGAYQATVTVRCE